MQFDDFTDQNVPVEQLMDLRLDEYEPTQEDWQEYNEWLDGQPDEYTEWQDLHGGDDWDHGQFDQFEF